MVSVQRNGKLTCLPFLHPKIWSIGIVYIIIYRFLMAYVSTEDWGKRSVINIICIINAWAENLIYRIIHMNLISFHLRETLSYNEDGKVR